MSARARLVLAVPLLVALAAGAATIALACSRSDRPEERSGNQERPAALRVEPAER